MNKSWHHYVGERHRLIKGAGGVQCSVCTRCDRSRRGIVAMCLTSSILHGQAALLRSHAGGLSVVAAAECMLYAASEVSAILRKASVGPSPSLTYPCPSTTQHPLPK